MEIKIKHNLPENIIHVVILRPFYTAGIKLGWDSKVGLGFEPNLIKGLLNHKARLCCYISEENCTVWIDWVTLKKFMESDNYKGSNQGKPIFYIPKALFCSEKPPLPFLMENAV